MRYDVYEILKKSAEGESLSEMDKFICKQECKKYEVESEIRKAKQEAKRKELNDLIISALKEKGKPLTPTDFQFIIFEKTGKRYSCATFSWYCGQLWIEKKLDYNHINNKTYYFIKKE